MNGLIGWPTYYSGYKSDQRTADADKTGACFAEIRKRVSRHFRYNGILFSSCAGEMAEWLKAHAWKACIP